MHDPVLRERSGEPGLEGGKMCPVALQDLVRRGEAKSPGNAHGCAAGLVQRHNPWFLGLFIPQAAIWTPGLLLLLGPASFPWESLRWLFELVMKNPEDMLTKPHFVHHAHTYQCYAGHCPTHSTSLSGAGRPGRSISLGREESRFQPSMQGVNILVCPLF